LRVIGLIVLIFVASALCCASHTMTDELGRTVTLPDHPHRLICLVPSVADDLYALGAGSDVVAVSEFTKFPKDASLKPTIGVQLTPSIERIVSLHPDLVIGSADSNREETVHELEQIGIVVFMLNPHGIEGVLSSIRTLGKAIGRDETATRLVVQLRARLDAIHEHVKDKPVIRVFMPIWYDPVITIGKRAFITEMIAAAGGKSITDDIEREWPQISLETIIERAPDALILVRSTRMTVNDVESRPGWNSLTAIRNRRIYLVDERIELPSSAAFEVLEDLARQLHPWDGSSISQPQPQPAR
jgi:iron complex transport system substrate-binding protein